MRALFASAAVALLLTACSAGGARTARPTPSSSARVSASASPTASAPRPPKPLSILFLRAADTMDPVDLSALAASEGADELASRLDDPRAHDTALQAIGYTDDAEVTYARLARRAKEHPGAETSAILDVFVRSLDRPERRGEILDDEGTHAAIADLRLVAHDQSRKDEERALAVSVLRRLKDRGFVDAAP